MNVVKKIFQFFSKNNQLKRYHNSEPLITKIKQVFNSIEKRNVEIAGATYTPPHSSQVLVYHAIGFSMNRLDDVIHTCEDSHLVARLVDHINHLKPAFIENQHDPDGVCAGTLVDVTLELEKLIDRSECEEE